MLEKHIELGVVKPAEAAGFFVRKVQWPGRRSAPDRVFAREDRGTVWIEFKRPGGSATLLQQREHMRMQAAGMEVHVCDSAQQALQILGIE
jgi:hypothetical protein